VCWYWKFNISKRKNNVWNVVLKLIWNKPNRDKGKKYWWTCEEINRVFKITSSYENLRLRAIIIRINLKSTTKKRKVTTVGISLLCNIPWTKSSYNLNLTN